MFMPLDDLQPKVRDAKHGIDRRSLVAVSLPARMHQQRLAEDPHGDERSELAHAVAFEGGRRPTEFSILKFEPELYPRLYHPRADSIEACLRFKSAELAATPRSARRGPGGLRV